jgi:hypothetical protein
MHAAFDIRFVSIVAPIKSLLQKRATLFVCRDHWHIIHPHFAARAPYLSKVQMAIENYLAVIHLASPSSASKAALNQSGMMPPFLSNTGALASDNLREAQTFPQIKLASG